MRDDQKNRHWVMQTSDELAIGFNDGRIMRYKIEEGELLYQQSDRAAWTRLSPEQTLQHLAIDTVVADWLRYGIPGRVRTFSKRQKVVRRAA
jgi:hypothetical protein